MTNINDPRWMNIMIEVPEDEALAILAILKEKVGFRDVDWSEMQRPDFARVTYSPCPPRTDSGYTIPPFTTEPRQP